MMKVVCGVGRGPAGAGRAVVWIRSHPDAAALLLLALAATVPRLIFFPRAPIFIDGDSPQYYVPANALMSGEGFPLALKRAPLYPVFIALIGQVLGQDLRFLVGVQHLLGVATAGLVYGVGCLTFGRMAGLLAGLAVALEGGLIIYEHYVMSEVLLTFLLTLAVFLFISAVWRDSSYWYAGSGLAMAAAALTKPHVLLMLPLTPLVVAVCYRQWRRVLRAAVLTCGVAAVVLLPWMARNKIVHGEFAITGATGQHLIYQTASQQAGRFVFFDAARHADDADLRRLEARRFIQQRSQSRADTIETTGPRIHARLMERLGLSETEANAMMLEVAVDAIRERPLTYAQVVLADFGRTFVGGRERLGGHWGAWREEDWPRERRHLIGPPTAEQDQGLATTQRLTDLYQAPRFGLLVPILFVVGLVASAAVPPWRLALFPGISVIGLHLASAATVGYLQRHHHPPDPIAHVLAAGGLLFLLAQARHLLIRVRGRGPSAASGAAHPEVLAG